MKTTVALVCGLLLLSGCGDDDPVPSPAPTSVAPSSSTATADPGPLEPTLPAAATRDGKAGAEAFVEHYWAMVNYAQRAGDTSALRAMGTSHCSLCDGGATWIEEVADAGGTIVGGDNEVVGVNGFRPPGQTNLWVVDADVSTAAARVRSPDPGQRQRYPAVTEQFRFSLRFDDGRWLITQWEEA